MTEGIARQPENSTRAWDMNTGIKFLRAAIAVALIGILIWVFRELSPLALDYPFRRAGDSAEFPPLGTLPFYVGCAKALFGMGFVWMIVFVTAIALAFTFKGFKVASWRSRFLASLGIIILSMTISAVYDIQQQMQWYRAHPSSLRPKHPRLDPSRSTKGA